MFNSLWRAAVVAMSMTLPPHQAFGENTPSFDLIELKRTSCFGICPEYSIIVRKNGGVEYNGVTGVKIKGQISTTISPVDLAFLNLAVNRLQLAKLKDSYLTESDGCEEVWTDHPSIVIRIEYGDLKKSVTAYLGCYGLTTIKRLSWLADTIDETTRSNRWVGLLLMRTENRK